MSETKKKIGISVAIEMEAIYKLYPEVKELPAPKGFKLLYAERDKYEMYFLQAGMGEIAAAAGIQYLITGCHVSLIFNFGVVGGLTPDMKQLKVCLVDRVVHYKYDCSEFMDLAVGQVDGHDSVYLLPSRELLEIALALQPEMPTVTCCSGDKFVGTVEEKTALHNTFAGDICDMESAGIVLACEMNGVPCILLKAVSDGLADGADGFYTELQNASVQCLREVEAILNKIAETEA